MKICIVETESSERAFFERELTGHELQFADSLDRIGEPSPEILSIFIYSRIDAALLDAHPGLKMIATRSSGCDHIDLEECKRRGIAVCSVPDYGDHTVAEHTFALMLAVARRLREAMTMRGEKFSYEKLRGLELNGKTLGVIGTGRIGRRTIEIAKIFGMRVLAHDSHENAEAARALGFRYVPLDELLCEADVISLHAMLTPQSHHILDRAAFAKCKRGVLIINTARGRLIDTEALIEAIDAGIVGGAGLDVLGEEKVMRERATQIISDSIARRLRGEGNELLDTPAPRLRQMEKLIHLEDLLSRPNVVFTPHIAFNTNDAVERIHRITVENIRAFAAGKPINLC